MPLRGGTKSALDEGARARESYLRTGAIIELFKFSARTGFLSERWTIAIPCWRSDGCGSSRLRSEICVVCQKKMARNPAIGNQACTSNLASTQMPAYHE
jgi:hypothetical protein